MQSDIDVGRIRSRVRQLSKSLLGAQFRAEIAAFIALGEAPFWARSMAQQLSIPENKISAELVRFADGGLLSVLSVAQWDRRRLYERNPAGTEYWELGSKLVRQAAAEEAIRQGVDTEDALKVYLASTAGGGL